MVATRWVPIIALILFLLGSISLKSSAFHTHSSVVVGRLNNGAMMLVSSMTMINNDESIIRDSIDVPVPFARLQRWRQRRRVNNYYDEEQHQRATQTPVPHAGRHFFPSHPAYRRPLLRRMFQKIRRRQRFMEGWYYRLTLKDYEIEIDGDNNNDNSNGTTAKLPALSFAFIISIEDAGIKSSDLRLACLQAIGPNDQYLIQATKDDTAFWASKQTQSLGCTFEKYDDYENNNNEFETNNVNNDKITTRLDPNIWKESVRSGFQIIDDSDSDDTSSVSMSSTLSPQHQPRWMGRINGHDGSKGGVLNGQGAPGALEFDFAVDPDSVCGYGGYTTSRSTNATTKITVNDNSNDVATGTNRTSTQNRQQNQYATRQKSTGGWLSSFPIFEPHWQVTMSDALATGSVIWNGTKYAFEDQPFYAEKNWGDALPSKWYWTQCNSFDNEDELSVTAGGGIRKIKPTGREEELGMIAVHYKGQFYEAVPWKGNVEWNVSTWGEWSLYGDRLEETTTYNGRGEKITTPPFAVEVRYRCDPKTIPGLVFRAPTPRNGMVPFCRDTFEADCELTLWELKQNETTKKYEKIEPPIINRATSKEGGAEIGGGPWWSDWHGKSQLKPVIKTLLNLQQ